MNKKVLVVDDETAVLRTVRGILEAEDIEVLTAESGRECIETVKNGFRGLVLMDVSMPEMDGWQTIEILKKEELIDGLVICMLTAKEIPDSEMNLYKELVLDYITKPFDRKELVRIVKEHLAYL